MFFTLIGLWCMWFGRVDNEDAWERFVIRLEKQMQSELQAINGTVTEHSI